MAQDIKVEQIGGLTCEPMAGFNHRTIKIALLSWFASIAAPKVLCDDDTPANEGVNFEELGEISGTHTFKAGYGFMTLEVLQETASLESPMIGDKKGRLLENKANFHIAGSTSKLIGFNRWIKNKDFIVLMEEVESGRSRQIGSERFAANVAEFTGIIEGAPEGGNRQEYVVSDKQVMQAPVYKGTVTDMPAQA